MGEETSISRANRQIVNDFKGRRKGILKALTTDFDDFYEQCDPEKENLYLLGLPNGKWKVHHETVKKLPPALPDPLLGINFVKEEMNVGDWKSMVALHSDSWLVSMAFHQGAKIGFNQKDRKKLFKKINHYPTVLEMVKRNEEKRTGEEPTTSTATANRKKRKRIIEKRRHKKPHSKRRKLTTIPEEPEQNSICGACGDSYGKDDLNLICCDDCENWFHVKCVKILPVKAESIKTYKCPFCKQDDSKSP